MNKPAIFVFHPSRKYNFSLQTTHNKNNNTTTLIKKYKPERISLTQKNFNTFRPVRPFNRFGKSKISENGIDPEKVFLNFTFHDVKKPYKKPVSEIITNGTKYIPTSPLKWSVGTTYTCINEPILPKKDPYKEYNFIKRSDDKTIYQETYLPTDHISIRMPDLSKSVEKNPYPFLKMKGSYGKHSDSESFWYPKRYNDFSIANRSSVSYNIINNDDNYISGVKDVCMFEKTIHNKKKGLEEFVDLQRPFEPNISKIYEKFEKENEKGFNKYKGVFTELYDSSTKNGNIYAPFRREDYKVVKKENKKNSVDRDI